MYTLTQILKDLAKESVPPPEMIRTIWDIVFVVAEEIGGKTAGE